MNQELYNDLLLYSKKLISKFNKESILDEYDLVHESWDFIETDKVKIRVKIGDAFFQRNSASVSHISFSNFKNKDGEIIPIENIVTTETKTISYEGSDRQCKRCLNIIPISFFGYDKRRRCHEHKCIKCKGINRTYHPEQRHNYFLKNREAILNKVRVYGVSENGRSVKKEYKLQHKESTRKQNLEYYYRNKEKILFKKKEKIKAGLWIDRTAHERYLRYKEKQKAV